MRTILLSLLCLSLLPLSSPLTIHYTNTSTNPPVPGSLFLPSVYATIGPLPSSPLSLNASILTTQTCHLNNQIFKGKALVYTRNLADDFFLECSTFHKASSVTISRLAQHAGASLVIIGSVFKIESGRAVGFTSSIGIPVVVIPHHLMPLFTEGQITEFRVELDPVTNEEKSQIEYLVRLWYTWRSIAAVLYGLTLLLVGYLLYKEIYFQKTKIGLVMKVFALYTFLLSFLWIAVDPFGFEGILFWNAGFLVAIHFSSVVVTICLILVIWMKAASKMNPTYQSVVTKIIYTFCISFYIFSIIAALPLWKSNLLYSVMNGIMACALILVAILYLIIGKDMISVLLGAPSLSSSSHARSALIIKIVCFIMWYVLIAVGIVTVFVLNVLGPIFFVMFGVVFDILGLSMGFLIMFFQPFRAKKHAPILKERDGI